MIANFLLGYAIAQFRQSSRVWLIGGIILDLGLIGYFKYAGFLVSGLNDIFSASFVVPHIVLPVGISFYTFEQISYLVETRQSGRAEPSLMRYALFVSFFPHLIAGPIIRPHQLLPQFSNPALGRFDWQNFAIGTTFLLFGLFKKVILADGIQPSIVRPRSRAGDHLLLTGHSRPGARRSPTPSRSISISPAIPTWRSGSALMFGIVLLSTSPRPTRPGISEFWRRWHMTLSRFLRDYLYFPLGGNRHGEGRRYMNLMVTMLLGGLWHGAAWTFVTWGGLHGVYLS